MLFCLELCRTKIKPYGIMKFFKTILAVLALGAMLASCNKSPIPGTMPEKGEIYFGSRGIYVETKAVNETTSDILQSEGFRCAASIDADKSVMFNTGLSYADGFYKVPGKKYFFPAEGTVSFYAVYPGSEEIRFNLNGDASINYVQDDTEDFVAACSMQHAASDDAVILSFAHKLSQLVVKCKGDDPETDFFMKSIAVTSPKEAAYVFKTDSWVAIRGSNTCEAVADGGEAIVQDQDFSKSMTFIPGEIQVRFVWECRIKGTQTVVGEYDQSITTTLVRGRRSTMNVTLCNSIASELRFTASVDDWEDEEKDYKIEDYMAS